MAESLPWGMQHSCHKSFAPKMKMHITILVKTEAGDLDYQATDVDT